MPKPAEGPWRVSWSRESQSWLILNEDERMIATAFESETNARRIAATPDLLEVLSIFVDCYPAQIEPLKQRARHLIAKARGE